MIADALPDTFGNALIDLWMEQHGVPREQVTPLDRLAFMGTRGIGALEFKPARSRAYPGSAALDLPRLAEAARSALKGSDGQSKGTQSAAGQLLQVGTVAGGARAKAAIAWNPATGEIRAGHREVAPGFEHWLIKFDCMGPSKNPGRVEYAYHLMARAAGINMSPCRLIEEGPRAHFMTRRFDREGNRKHHLQTLCAMAQLDFRQTAAQDYSQFLLTVKRLVPRYAASEEAFRRMAFNVMAANGDDHAKNISFILREGEGWDLAPAYDLNPVGTSEGTPASMHAMAVSGKYAGITRADLLAVANRFAIGTAKQVLAKINDAVEAWPDFAKAAGVEAAETARIQKIHRPI
jgi:serine/threonine-protein kinase HipA